MTIKKCVSKWENIKLQQCSEITCSSNRDCFKKKDPLNPRGGYCSNSKINLIMIFLFFGFY